MSYSNVINFPNHKKTQEEFVKKEAETQKKYSDSFSETLCENIFAEMERDGIVIEDDEEALLPSAILIMESVVALHYKANGLYHPLHDFSQEAFDESIKFDITKKDDDHEKIAIEHDE